MKLGRLAPDYSKPRLWAEDYYTTELPPLAAAVDYCSHVPSWPVYLNDQISDCTIAAAGHMIQAWSAYAGTETAVSDDDVLRAYEAVSGYDPATGANDNGAVMSGVLAYWQSTGIGGHKIEAYAQIRNPTTLALNQCLQVFGSCYIGVNLPVSAQDQFPGPWTYVKGSPIAGGHAICLQRCGPYVDAETYISWGQPVRTQIKWADTYIEEAWAVLDDLWVTASGKSPAGLDVATMRADMSALAR